MLQAALFSEVQGLTPVGKYFLVRFIQCFGISDPVDLGVKDLAKRFGLTDRQVSSALADLLARNVMVCCSNPIGRGRPKTRYELTDDFRRDIRTRSAPSAAQHEAAVVRLLKHEDSKRRDAGEIVQKHRVDTAPLAELRSKRQPGQLTIVNRLLLSVLLCRADRFGVVSDLGTAELCALTGLDEDALKNRVRRLIAQGLIRTYVPGATSSVFFAKVKNVYFLNLNHEELSEGAVVVSVLVCPKVLIDKEGHSYRLFKQVKQPETYDGNDPEYVQILSFLKGQGSAFFLLLQYMLDTCAAYWLSTFWAELVAQPNPSQEALLKGQYATLKELVSKNLHPVSLLAASGKGLNDILLERVFWSAHFLAVAIKAQLVDASYIPFESMDFVIIPRPQEYCYTSIAPLALPKSSNGWRGALIAEKIPYLTAELQHLPGESVIPLEYRYSFGLLTRPSGKASTS